MILTIKKKWFEMIRKGIKTEEYRELNNYYAIKFQNLFGLIFIAPVGDYGYENAEIIMGDDVPEEIRKDPIQDVILRNGYRNDSDCITISCTIRIGEGKTEWGAEPGKKYFVLSINSVKEER